MFAKLLALANNKKRGFTLIELIVVIAIIGILIAILVPTVTGYVNDARRTAAAASGRSVYVAAQAYLTKQETQGNNVAVTDMTVANLSAYLGSTFTDVGTGGGTVSDGKYNYAITADYPNHAVTNVVVTTTTGGAIATITNTDTTYAS